MTACYISISCCDLFVLGLGNNTVNFRWWLWAPPPKKNQNIIIKISLKCLLVKAFRHPAPNAASVNFFSKFGCCVFKEWTVSRAVGSFQSQTTIDTTALQQQVQALDLTNTKYAHARIVKYRHGPHTEAQHTHADVLPHVLNHGFLFCPRAKAEPHRLWCHWWGHLLGHQRHFDDPPREWLQITTSWINNAHARCGCVAAPAGSWVYDAELSISGRVCKAHATFLPKTRRLLSVITGRHLLTLKNNDLLKMETMMSDLRELKEAISGANVDSCNIKKPCTAD